MAHICHNRTQQTADSEKAQSCEQSFVNEFGAPWVAHRANHGLLRRGRRRAEHETVHRLVGRSLLEFSKPWGAWLRETEDELNVPTRIRLRDCCIITRRFLLPGLHRPSITAKICSAFLRLPRKPSFLSVPQYATAVEIPFTIICMTFTIMS